MWTLLYLFACSGGASNAPTPPSAPAPAAEAPFVAPAVTKTVTKAEPTCTMKNSCESDCNSGDPLACSTLGLWAQYGLNGVAYDPTYAAELQERSCELGAGVGCFNLGAQRIYGVGVDSDQALGNSLLSKAVDLHQASCDAGGRTWCVNLAAMLLMGQGVEQDRQRGLTLLRKECADGTKGACIQLAMVTGSTDKKAKRVLLQKDCSSGTIDACSYLGETYLDIEPIDLAAASMWFKMGCDSGHPAGCRNLGFQHVTGQGAPQDAQRGLELLELACKASKEPDSGACHLAGITLRDGALGLMPEPQRAGEFLLLACRMGESQACVDAVALAASGKSTVPARNELGTITKMACRMGNATACKLMRPPM